MKKVEHHSDELRPEYQREDFDTVVRGKYAKRMQESSNVIILDPDVAKAFPNSQAVNETLRHLIELAKSHVQAPPQA